MGTACIPIAVETCGRGKSCLAHFLEIPYLTGGDRSQHISIPLEANRVDFTDARTMVHPTLGGYRSGMKEWDKDKIKGESNGTKRVRI